MRTITPLCIAGIVGLSGCETMFTHYKLSSTATQGIATTDAAVNYCLPRGLVDRMNSQTFSALSADVLGMAVYDRDLYTRTYDQRMAAVKESMCAGLGKDLPAVNTKMAQMQGDISRQLVSARNAEALQLASMGSGGNAVQPMSMAPVNTTAPSWSNKPNPPSTQTYLVNTPKGLVRCQIINGVYANCS